MVILPKEHDFIDFNTENLKGLQKKSLIMLKYFKEFCRENGLTFYLCGGCCIGAVRNNGFIPWDDDVDVFMPRNDYEKLSYLWNEKADTKKFSCVRNTKDKFSGNIFITIVDNNTTLIKPYQQDLDIPHGVVMDVFPLDGCPSGKIKRKIQMGWAIIYSLYSSQMVPKNHGAIIGLLGSIMLGLVPSSKLRYRIWSFAQKQMSKYSIEECDKITELCAGPHYMKNEYPKAAFREPVYKEFEGCMMPIPTDYDKYLLIAFGNYMALPPKEEQIPHHDIIFLDLDNSYKKYKGVKYCTEEKI